MNFSLIWEAVMLFISITAFVCFIDARVKREFESRCSAENKRVVVLPVNRDVLQPAIELTETELKIRERAQERNQAPLQWRTLQHPEADAGLGSGSSSLCLDWEEEQLQGQQGLVHQTDPKNPYFSEGCGIDPNLVPDGMKVN